MLLLMNPDSAFSINSTRFAHETVDGEVIVIDMQGGNYFNMRDCAATIWGLLEQGQPIATIMGALSAACGTPKDDIAAEVEPFLAALCEEGILSAGADANSVTTQPNLTEFAFAPPTLSKFTEMQDLLTLDPIHEVDETGWPNRQGPGSG